MNLYPYLKGSLENLDYFSELADLALKNEFINILLDGLKVMQCKEFVLYSKGMRQKVSVSIAYAKI